MNVAEARVVERREPAAGQVLLWLDAPPVSRGARPGQFVMLHRAGVFDPFLARPYWIHRVRDGEDGEEFAVLIGIGGHGAAMIAMAAAGDRLQVVGPLGRPLPIATSVHSLLLIGDGVSVSPLVWCADHETARGRSVTLLMGAETESALYPLDLVQPEVEVLVATADGTAGIRGTVSTLVGEYASWADQIILSGPDPLYQEAAARLRSLFWRRPCYALSNTRVPCGTGICGMCATATRRKGLQLACRSGPVFELRDLT